MAHFETLVFLILVGLALAKHPTDRIDPKLKTLLAKSNSKANIVISMTPDTSYILNQISSTRFSGRAKKIEELKAQLKKHTHQYQKAVLHFLEKNDAKFKSFWITNRIFVENADLSIVDRLATFYDVAHIREEYIIELEQPKPEAQTSSSRALQWGVERIGADRVWGLAGNTDGTGVVVANIDTGVRYTHEALRGNWRSDYGWYDPSGRTATPVDNNGHGTHTMGTIAGFDGIGVAPGAQWIACRGCATSSCSEAALIGCGQWVVCPTDPQGNNADCSKAPHLVSNSWGGGTNDPWYNDVTLAWGLAGIVPLFSLGNSGPSCGSAGSPGNQPGVIGVGSTDSRIPDSISSFSGRGPNGNMIKPDICAPGGSVYSAYYTSDTAYATFSGTSMSCPHAAGATALVLGVAPNATIADVKALLQNNAVRNVRDTGANCGGIPDTQFPNNVYGYGRIDVYSSVISVIGRK